MEILPGRGVASIELGADRAAVRARLGAPTSERGDSAFYMDRDPGLVLRFAASGSLELIEIPYSGNGHEVTLGGIQLTYRAIDDVVEELRQAGIVGRRFDIGFEFPQGFAIWSMASLNLADIDSSISVNDERLVVEGVSVGVPEYFGF